MAFPLREQPSVLPATRRLRPSVVVALTCSLAFGLGSAASADPVPSQDDVDRAQQQVARAVSDVAAMDVQIAQLEKTQQDALQNAAVAGEAYNQAVVDYEAAVTAAADAQARSDEADASAEESRRVLVALFRDSSHSGGLDELSMYLSADGIADAVTNANALGRVNSKADKALQQYQADSVVAEALQEVAQEAVADETTKRAAAEGALTLAEQAQTDADDAVASAATQRSQLVSALAAAQNTSVEVEQARQDGLAAERQRAVEEAARRRVEEAAAAAPPAVMAPTTPAPDPSSPGPSTPAQTTPPVAPDPTAPPTTAPPTTAPPTTAPPTTAPPTTPPTPTPTPTTPPVTGGGTSKGTAAQGQAAVDWAKTQTGLPYVWGANGPDAYDCSGLSSKAWGNAGVSLRRTSRDQYTQTLKISLDDLRPGDLVFWASNTSQPSTIFHVAIYAGNNQIVEAAQPGVPSRVTHMRWNSTLMPFAGRP